MNTIIFILASIGAFVVFCTVFCFLGWFIVAMGDWIERRQYRRK